MVDPTIWMGPWSLANSGGMPIATLGRLSPCKDHVISANPGGVMVVNGWYLPVLAPPPGLVQLGDLPSGWWLWPSAILYCRLPKNNPLVWGLWLLLWLHSPGEGSSFLEDVIITHLEGGMSSSTSALVNVVWGSIACHSSSTLSASQWGLPGVGGWAFSAQYCRAFAYARIFCSCISQKSLLPNCISWRGKNQSWPREWGAGIKE